MSHRPITMDHVLDHENWDRAVSHCHRGRWSPEQTERLRYVAYSRTDPVHRALRDGTYKPRRCRVRMEPKPGGGKRTLRIPPPRDMVITRALGQVLTPQIDPLLSEGCCGYRPHRGQHDAVLAARPAAREYPWSVGTDVRACFDSVKQDLVLADFDRHRLANRPVRALIRSLLARIRGGVGLVTGCPLSPLLLNLHLRPVDLVLEAEGVPWWRYSDNLLLLGKTRRQVEDRLEVLRGALVPVGMELHPRKTTFCLTRQAEFLGYQVGNLHPTCRAIQRHWRHLRETIDRLSSRVTGHCDPSRTCPMIKGWVNYFRLCPSPRPFVDLDRLVESIWQGWPWDMIYTTSWLSARLVVEEEVLLS